MPDPSMQELGTAIGQACAHGFAEAIQPIMREIIQQKADVAVLQRDMSAIEASRPCEAIQRETALRIEREQARAALTRRIVAGVTVGLVLGALVWIGGAVYMRAQAEARTESRP